jgi:hypothetical protein
MAKMVDNRKLTRGDLDRALRALDEQDRIRIEGMVDKAVEQMQDQPNKVMFGKLSALELIARVGIYLAKNNIDKI